VSPGPANQAKRRLGASVCGLSVLLAALDAYVVVTILTEMARDLGVPINHLERVTPIVTSYLLGYVAAMPLLGQLSDRHGRGLVLQGCMLGFVTGSVVSATASSLGLLVVGRLIQGAAGGAVLPITFAVIGDQWEAHDRPVPLGVIGGAQELGSVLGPLYGAALAALIGWRGLFWVNVPLGLAALIAIRRTFPPSAPVSNRKIDVVGGGILAGSLASLVAGLYNPDPAASVLPPWGPWAIIAGAMGLVGFVVWERRSPIRLIEASQVRTLPFSAALATSFLSGVALMVTLVDVPLLAQTLLDKNTTGAALFLLQFLIALSAGALAGGALARRLGERQVAVAGLLVASAGYRLVAGWPVRVLAAQHHFGFFALSRAGFDLAIAGLGLGLIIAPVASVALLSADADAHGTASAGVVLARVMGMLIGIAALAAWGLHRFQQLTARLSPPLPFGSQTGAFERQMAAYQTGLRAALHVEYHEIFVITSAVCLAAALVALGLGRGQSRNVLRPREATQTPA